MNRKKWLLWFILIFTFLLILLFIFFENRFKYQRLVLKSSKWDTIIQSKKEDSSLTIKSIKFNDYRLLIDESNDIIYYSVIDSSQKYNPKVDYDVENGVKISFSDKITQEKIENNYSFKVLVYDDSTYHIYELKVTTLPIIHLSYDLKKDEETKDISMDFYLFDNRKNAYQKVVNSIGVLDIVENGNEKADYHFSLSQESLGKNMRDNPISLLGMDQHSEFVLNSLYDDDEKIRNVFSTNLWNSLEGNEEFYQYVELFVNNEYVGLYSFGYDIESRSLQLDNDEFLFYKRDLSSSEMEYGDVNKLEGYVLYDYRLKKVSGREENRRESQRLDEWKELNNYYETLLSSDVSKIKELSDLDNSIHLYLFYLLTQATDHVNQESFAHTYLLFENKKGHYQVRYIPWNMHDAFLEDSASDNRFIMVYNPVSRLIELEDSETIQKVKKVYQELRKAEWSEDKILDSIQEYKKDIFSSGAYFRDKARWEYDSNITSLEDFSNYVLERLDSLDTFIEQL